VWGGGGGGGGEADPSPSLPSNPLISHLALYDVVGTPGVAADLAHIDTPARVTAHTGDAELGAALAGAALVVIPAGVPRKPGMTRDDLFNINAGIVATLAQGVARYCPLALVAIISNPVNSTVPIAAEILKAAGVFDPRKLFGVTTLDVVRARAFVAEAAGVEAGAVDLPVVGGHAGVTILPLISQAKPRVGLPPATVAALTARIQDAGTEVVTAKAGKGSATLSMAYAAARFANSCLVALAGGEGVVECAYVACSDAPAGAPFFARRVSLGPSGIAASLPLGPLSSPEISGLDALAGELAASIDKGAEFGRAWVAKQGG